MMLWGGTFLVASIIGLTFKLGEVMNFLAHYHQRTLRMPNSEGAEDDVGVDNYKIPRGYGFNQVSCANYFWESIIWISFSLLTRSKVGNEPL